MSNDQVRAATPAVGSYDFFYAIYDAVDRTACFWEPMLKSVGRWHLEVAGLTLRNGEASVRLANELARASHPGEVMAAQVRYWDRVSATYAQASQRLVGPAAKIGTPATTPDVVHLPVRQRDHDVIILQDKEDDQLKVA